MKLYEVPQKSYVLVVGSSMAPPGAVDNKEGDVLYFYHIDGMYSYCKDEEGNIRHLPAWQEVIIVPETCCT